VRSTPSDRTRRSSRTCSPPDEEGQNPGFGIHDHNPRPLYVPLGGLGQAGPLRVDGREEPPYTQRQLAEVRKNDHRSPSTPDDQAMDRWAREGFASRGPGTAQQQSASSHKDILSFWDALPLPPRDDREGWIEYHPATDLIPDELSRYEVMMRSHEGDPSSGIRPSVLRAFQEMSPAERERRAGMTDEDRAQESALDAVRDRTW
jgi:hypothetical protein